MHYTGTVYRNPYVHPSPLLEITQGCSHNKCKFCNMYSAVKFQPSNQYIELTKIQPFQMNMHYEIVDVLVAGSLGDVRNQPNKFTEAYEIGKSF